jgi:hypothetical protein
MSDTQVEAEPWANRIVQSAAPRTETGIELDGELHENYPHPHPSIRHTPEGTRVTVPGAR